MLQWLNGMLAWTEMLPVEDLRRNIADRGAVPRDSIGGGGRGRLGAAPMGPSLPL